MPHNSVRVGYVARGGVLERAHGRYGFDVVWEVLGGG